MPEQVEALVEHLGKTVEEMLGKELAYDYWTAYPNDIFVLAPNIEGNSEITYPGNPNGRCAFFKNGKCSIHEVKPFECRDYIHTNAGSDVSRRHESVAMAWKEVQDDIKQLEELREEAAYNDNPSIFDFFGGGYWD
jgi:Fe-S-cluster containining protein